jgi:single-strand DNA-binding protein
MNFNQTIVAGRLGRDPELKVTPNGTEVAKFSVASNRVWYDKDKQKQEETEWHNVVAFGRTAENIAKYFNQGDEIFILGRLKTSSWDDKDSGKKMYRTEIIAEKFDFGQKRKGSETQSTAPSSGVEYPAEDINPEDIPF